MFFKKTVELHKEVRELKKKKREQREFYKKEIGKLNKEILVQRVELESVLLKVKELKNISTDTLIHEIIESVPIDGTFSSFDEKETNNLASLCHNIWEMSGFHKIVDKLLASQVHEGFKKIGEDKKAAELSYAMVLGIRLLYDEIRNYNNRYIALQNQGGNDFEEHDVI